MPRTQSGTIDFYGLGLDILQSQDDGITASIQHLGDGVETRLARRYATAEDRLLVAGFGSGGTGALLASRFGPDRVFGIEANPHLVDQVRRNVRVAGQPIAVECAALTAATGVVRLYVDRDAWGIGSLQPSAYADAEILDVPALSIAEAIAWQETTFLVLDVEGGEFGFWHVMPWERLRGLVAELHGSPTDVANLLRAIPMPFREVYHTESGAIVAATRDADANGSPGPRNHMEGP